ncbi:MAG TPA: tRNA (adenosine(37)-N6)-threonylcarbamoyltransferase complex ATPase subunit type 1 TsaE [Rhodospirillaceae bacterium]|nr:tRNA (adenosine(37)-N6)-threonylcarbamoyltransferase complex ATPase subunit type 1 TsaE [Rhodospirillaceae bacterium]
MGNARIAASGKREAGLAPDIIIELPDEGATCALAARLARLARSGDVFALAGDLGSGKTTLARAFIRSLTDPAAEVPSPTFTFCQAYDFDYGIIWHFDLYRMEKPEDAVELGIEQAFSEGISLIEWPERLGRWLPADCLTVALTDGQTPDARLARLSGGGGWSERLGGIAG